MPGGMRILDELVNTYNIDHHHKINKKIDSDTSLIAVFEDSSLFEELRSNDCENSEFFTEEKIKQAVLYLTKEIEIEENGK